VGLKVPTNLNLIDNGKLLQVFRGCRIVEGKLILKKQNVEKHLSGKTKFRKQEVRMSAEASATTAEETRVDIQGLELRNRESSVPTKIVQAKIEKRQPDKENINPNGA